MAKPAGLLGFKGDRRETQGPVLDASPPPLSGVPQKHVSWRCTPGAMTGLWACVPENTAQGILKGNEMSVIVLSYKVAFRGGFVDTSLSAHGVYGLTGVSV